jgi:uncharacterized damage-inducible protein DinB
MNIQELIKEIKNHLIQTFSNIDTWFEKDAKLREYQPKSGGWSINQILEHIGLTSHFLLILIEKGTRKALANVQNLNLKEELANYNFHRTKLEEVGQHRSYAWIRPEHMEPKGEKTLEQVRQQLKDQLKQCITALEKLPSGEGILSKTTMSVNDLGKIDVYEYIYFLSQHGQRHISQMEKVEQEFTTAFPR